jgi:hypothetical protein
MSVHGVRHEKVRLSRGCKPHPASAPAGSNRSSHGGNEMAEALPIACHELVQRMCAGRNASERRASLEKDDAQVDPNPFAEGWHG